MGSPIRDQSWLRFSTESQWTSATLNSLYLIDGAPETIETSRQEIWEEKGSSKRLAAQARTRGLELARP